MKKPNRPAVMVLGFAGLLLAATLHGAAQPEPQTDPKKVDVKKDFDPGKGPPMMVGGPFGQQRKLVKQFDKDGDGRLNNEERKAAREFIKKQGGPGGFGPGGGPKGVFGPGGFLTKPLLDALDTEKEGKLSKDQIAAAVEKFFAECDKDKQGTLSANAIAEGLNRLLPQRAGFFAAPPPGLPKEAPKAAAPKSGDPKADAKGPKAQPGFAVFGFGNVLATNIVKRAGPDKDGKITLDKLLAATEALFKESDKNNDGKLDSTELTAAITALMPMPKFGPGGFGQKRDPAKPGPRVLPADVNIYPEAPLYESTILRTLFLEFENRDWEAELADFRNTDVLVPCTLTVDGKVYGEVGVHFRGMSSYFGVQAGYKRSLNLSLDFVDKKQRLYGYKTLNLLNSHDDPGFMHTVLFSDIARQYIPAPKANFVKVVINGESWGVYVNAQQFNKEFIAENYQTTKGARWKVRGSPGAGGGLDYIGDNVEEYKKRYTIKSKDEPKDWKALIKLCRTLSETPLDKLEEALKPMLDIDGVLWFLALDNALINNDGYWVRASDYSLYRDPKGKFHVIPHDTNETFQAAMFMGFGAKGFKGPKGGPGEGGPGGPGEAPKFDKGDNPKGGKAGGAKGEGPKGEPFVMPFGPGGMGKLGAELDPLIGMDDVRKPLRSRLLSVPSLRARYLQHVRTIAETQLDWNKLRPRVVQYRSLIEEEVALDTRKLYTLDAFKRDVADTVTVEKQGIGGPNIGLRAFADQRRNFLINHPEVKKVGGR